MNRQMLLPAALLGAALAGCTTEAPPTGTTPPGSQPPPAGKQLVSGAFIMRGMTSDGWAVYSDVQTLRLHAVPISGGDAQDIVSLGDDFAISIWGKTVFAWSHKNAASVGPLTVWTSSGGPHAVSSSSLAPWVAATMDGSHLLYLDAVDPTGQTGSLVAASAGGASPHTLLTGLTGLSTGGCQALLGFAGSYALAAHCAAGATRATISSFDTSAWKQADLAVGAADSWVTDPAGTILLTATSAGTVVVPLGGGSPTIIDASGSTGVLVDNGQTAIYGASTSMLRRSAVSSPSPTTLVGSGVAGLYGVSPDGRFALYYSMQDAHTLVSDLYLTSATTPGATTTLSSTENAGVFGDAFTTDGSHVLYGTGYDATSQTMTIDALALGSASNGTMQAAGVGASPTVLTHTGWVVWAATGAKVVYSDQFDATGPRADIRSTDTSTSGASTLLVSQADVDFFLSPAHDQVVYTWSQGNGPQVGLYVVGIP